MLNSKLDLFQQSWIDTVFEGRNKEYGAYDLRKREASLTARAMIIGGLVFSLLISLPVIMKKVNLTGRATTIDKVIEVIELPPPPAQTEDTYVPPPPPEQIKSVTEIKKFTPPVVGDDSQVTEELVRMDDLKDKIAGTQNVDASADGDVMIDETPVAVVQEKKIIEDRQVYDVKAVQVMPEYPGGISKFVEFIVYNLHGIQLEDARELRMQFRFVIEKDGTLTDIQTISDGGFPQIAERAIRVLGSSQKWSPGVINGKKVRVAYTVPIVIRAENF